MIDDTNPPDAILADLGREVDKLLRQIPAANERPTLVREGPSAPSSPVSPVSNTAQRQAAPRRASAQVRMSPGGTATRTRGLDLQGRLRAALPWFGALTAVGLGAAVTQWPYARDCGMMLHLYLGVTGSVMIVGGWTTISAWKVRNAGVHLIGALVMFWGIVLAAEQILPRIGYAAVPAAWSCTQ